MAKRAQHFEDAIKETKAIRLAVDSISKNPGESCPCSFGIKVSDSEHSTCMSSSEDETSLSEQSDMECESSQNSIVLDLSKLAEEANFNYQAELKRTEYWTSV